MFLYLVVLEFPNPLTYDSSVVTVRLEFLNGIIWLKKWRIVYYIYHNSQLEVIPKPYRMVNEVIPYGMVLLVKTRQTYICEIFQ